MRSPARAKDSISCARQGENQAGRHERLSQPPRIWPLPTRPGSGDVTLDGYRLRRDRLVAGRRNAGRERFEQSQTWFECPAVRVLIVDDSPTICGILKVTLGREPNIEIVGTANTASQARDAVEALRPDWITLDVEMPGMNGLSFCAL
jgi:hypothetical protein